MDVQDYLRSHQQPWRADFQDRAERLPDELREALRQEERPGQPTTALLADLLHSGGTALRQLVAEVFFPHFPDTAARTIEALLGRHPYPQGYARRAFRAPHHPLHAQRAAAWVLSVWHATRDYPQDLEWFAVHAGLLNSWQAHGLGLLFAQALDDGNKAVFEVLKATAATEHPTARMGRHVPHALLASAQPEAWALAERLLLAAQRQEGLRQAILEVVDEAHPEAFVRMLRVILQEGLLRFAACLRAADVWFGLAYDVTDVRAVRALLERALAYLEAPTAAWTAVQEGAGVDAHLALFTLGMQDAVAAAEGARALLLDPDPERRMAGAQFLLSADLLDADSVHTLMHDADVRLGALVARGVNRWQPQATHLTFDAVVQYAARLPQDGRHEPLLFPWLGATPDRSDVLDQLPALLGGRPFADLQPHLQHMSQYGKGFLLDRLLDGLKAAREGAAQNPTLDAPTRGLLVTLLQDRNSGVSEQAVKVMAHLTPSSEELEVLHALLKRRSADLRRGLIRLLAQDARQGQASAAALLGTRNAEQRQAGLQLLLEAKGQPPEDFAPANITEANLYAQLRAPDHAVTLEDGLGLFDPQALAPLTAPSASDRDFPRDVQRGAALLTSLDALIAQHRETPLSVTGWDGQETALLGNARPWQLRGDDMPLADLWEHWWAHRPEPQAGDLTRMRWALHHYAARQDATAEELLAELEAADAQPLQEEQRLRRLTLHRTLGPLVSLWLEHAPLLHPVLQHLTARHATRVDTDLALDALETVLAALPTDARMVRDARYAWRNTDPRDLLRFLWPSTPRETWTDAQWARAWGNAVYADRAFPHLPRQRPDVALLLAAEQRGWATRADLLDTLIGPRPEEEGVTYHGVRQFDALRDYTRRKRRPDLPSTPAWEDAVNAARARVLEVELARGDLETPATAPALNLQGLEGAETALRLLRGMGKNPLKRGYSGSNSSKDVTFSHLLRVSFPAPTDTAGSFAALATARGATQAPLLDLAVFAPQWAPLVAATLGWPGLHDAVYWLHAHTRDSNWSVPQEVRDAWEAEISERTPLAALDLTEGAVDVAWFRRMHATLGAARFTALLDAAKYASSSGGHKRAELYAQAILGAVPEGTLRERVQGKRNLDAARALGLLPLGTGPDAEGTLRRRYQLLSEFRRGARQFGAQRQASERRAADIGLQNLARTAGYQDPQRLMWTMEAQLAPDWSGVAQDGDVTARIHLTPDGEPSLHVQRGERTLKALPAALKKRPEVARLRAQVTDLTATRARMRLALEDAMTRGDLFEPRELTALAAHPVIAPMLRGLLWVLGERHLGWWRGDTLETLDGPQALAGQALRVAHPHDLFVSGAWRAHQQRIMEDGVTQPFKQAFREYYPITTAEQGAHRSARYAGHHVQPTQAAALLKARGWVSVPEEGVRKTYHHEGINVWVDAAVGAFTPNDVEGTPLHAVYFVRRDERDAMPLASVPPRLFSETMRDLDLVVSVAHTGGVDPEATLSTIGMRADLLRETLRLLQLRNVRVEHDHALIDGHHGQYSVHLGSGTVHRMPGASSCRSRTRTPGRRR